MAVPPLIVIAELVEANIVTPWLLGSRLNLNQ